MGDVQRELTSIDNETYLDEKKTKKKRYKGEKAKRNIGEGTINKLFTNIFFDTNRRTFLQEKEKSFLTQDETEELEELNLRVKLLEDPSIEFVGNILRATNKSEVEVTQEEVDATYAKLLKDVNSYNTALRDRQSGKINNKQFNKITKGFNGSNPILEFLQENLNEHGVKDILNITKEVLTKNTAEEINQIVKEEQAEKSTALYSKVEGLVSSEAKEEITNINKLSSIMSLLAFNASNPDRAQEVTQEALAEAEAAFTKVFPGRKFGTFIETFSNADLSIDEKLRKYFALNDTDSSNALNESDANGLMDVLVKKHGFEFKPADSDTKIIKAIKEEMALKEKTIEQKLITIKSLKSRLKDPATASVITGIVSEFNKIKEEGNKKKEDAASKGQYSIQDKLNVSIYLSNLVAVKAEENKKEGTGANYDANLKTVTSSMFDTLLNYLPQNLKC